MYGTPNSKTSLPGYSWNLTPASLKFFNADCHTQVSIASGYLTFAANTAVLVKIRAVQSMTPCSFVYRYQVLGGDKRPRLLGRTTLKMENDSSSEALLPYTTLHGVIIQKPSYAFIVYTQQVNVKG